MKFALYITLVFIVFQSCSNHPKSGALRIALQKKVDSLNHFVQMMKPGLGEYMTNIQLHHEKLWFAGMNHNWKLAAFETGEIKESVEQAKLVETDRPETKDLKMLTTPIEAMNDAIEKKDPEKFKLEYISLTNTCNSCHEANHFEFNVIKIPTVPPVSDQEFVAPQPH